MRLLEEVRNHIGNYHVKSGIYHYYRGEFTQAVEFFRKALRDEAELGELDRKTTRDFLTQTLMDSAERSAGKSEWDAAAQEYARAAEVSPDYPDIRHRLGRALEALDRFEEAVAQYRAAIDRNPDYLDARVALGFCLLRMGRNDDAAEAFREALERKTRGLRAPLERGIELLGRGEAVAAEEFFRETFRFSPELFAEEYREALAKLKARDWEGALEGFDRAIALHLRLADLHNLRGITLCELGRDDEGVAAFERSVELNPRHALTKLNLAFALLRAGRLKDAEGRLEAILAEDPGQALARSKLDELTVGRTADVKRTGSRGSAR